jgi:hypothetical protein
MAITGQMPLAKMQVAREVVPGTSLAATRKHPIMSGNLNEHSETVFPQEQRESFIANHRAFATKRWVEVAGMEVAPTFEDLPWYCNFSISCNMTGSPTAVTARRYAFTPLKTANDLGTATLELGDDTTEFDVNFAVMTRMELTIPKSAPATMTMDWLGQSATSGSFTSNLTNRTTEDINGALGTAYIDATTIGSTQVTNVMDAKVTIETALTQFWAFNGSLQPVDTYRSAARKAMVEMTIAFTNTTEYAAYQANIGASASTKRKIRYVVNGSTITGTSPSTTRSLTIDLYTIWTEAPFGESDGLRTIAFKGETIYDATADTDFSLTVVNDVVGGLG